MKYFTRKKYMFFNISRHSQVNIQRKQRIRYKCVKNIVICKQMTFEFQLLQMTVLLIELSTVLF